MPCFNLARRATTLYSTLLGYKAPPSMKLLHIVFLFDGYTYIYLLEWGKHALFNEVLNISKLQELEKL